MVYGRGKVRSTARTPVAGIGSAMTRRLGEAMAVENKDDSPEDANPPLYAQS